MFICSQKSVVRRGNPSAARLLLEVETSGERGEDEEVSNALLSLCC